MNFDSTLSFNIARKMDPGRSGAWLSEGPYGPGLMFGAAVIHDSADPVSQAEEWLAKVRLYPADRTPTLALVFGLGLGYHLQALRRRFPDIRLLVFEPIADIKNLYDSRKVMRPEDGPAPEIYTNWLDFEKIVSREVVYGAAPAVAVLSPEPYKSLRPEAFGMFNSFTGQELIRRSVIEKTRENSESAFLSNLALNAGHLPDLPDLMLLKGLLPAGPAFIVGSGPSLLKNAADLRDLGDRGLVIAAASAVKPLLSQGVRPDLVLILESQDTSSYLDLNPGERKILGDRTILALASSCHPAHFEIPGFVNAIFHLTAGAAQIFSRGAFLPQGGNSGSAGFALAYAWGLDPLILVGQDQAYESGRLHAEGTPGETPDQNDDALTVTGLDGRAVSTNTGLLASIGWFAEAAKTVAEQPDPPRLFNCSAGGAEVPGFAHCSLKEMAASLPPAGAKIDLPALTAKIPRFTAREISADLDQLASLVASLRKLARMDHRKAFAEIQKAGEISKFLGQVLAEAAVASGRKELTASMDRADELMTLMRSSFH